MSAKVTLLVGPARSGKTTWLVERYREALQAGPPGAALWLAPTWRASVAVRGRLLDGRHPGWFAPNVMTFDRFAEATVECASVPIRPIDQSMKRQLVRRIVDRRRARGRLEYFGPIAETSGLVDMLCDWIGEMKRLEIWPDQLKRACAARGMGRKDRELVDLYEDYQQALTEHQLYDAEGRFWSARDWLSQYMEQQAKAKSKPQAAEAALPRPWQDLRLVVVDGFSDFTHTQHEILELLARGIDELLISLPLESEGGREDLFAKPRATLERLKRAFRRAELIEFARDESRTRPALAHLERKLFANPRHTEDAPSTEGLEIIAAAGRVSEIEQIAARIKGLLLSGRARPGEIAVVFRSLSGQADLVRELFGRLGIPAALETAEGLWQCPVLRFLVRLLEMDADDWPTEDLLAVLRSNYFRPDLPQWAEGGTVAEVEYEMRGCGISGGREEWIRALRDRVGRELDHSGPSGDAEILQTGDQGETPAAEELSGSRLALAALEHLAAALDALPGRTSPAGWAQAWQGLAERLGVLRAIEQTPREYGELAELDRAGWQQLMDVLGQSDRLFDWLAEEPPLLDREEALAALRDVLAAESLPWSGDEWGKVRVLSAYSVRSLEVPYLFVAGLSERAFPPPEREDRFYGEAERRQLRAQGLPLPARVDRTQEEMLLFYEVVTRATKQLYFSYPALDEKSQPLLPSPFLREVEQAVGGAKIARTEATDPSPIPEPDRLFAPAEFRVRAMAEALEGKSDRLSRWLASPAANDAGENLLAALRMNQLRQQRDKFTEAEGLLTSQAAKNWFAARYGPGRLFRATELESYASCPFAFLMSEVLGLEPLEEPTAGVDYLERGRRVHAILADFHREINRRLGRPASPLELAPEETDLLLAELIDRHFAHPPQDPLHAALQEIDRQVIRTWLQDYRRQYEDYQARCVTVGGPVVPEMFEVSFGAPRHGDDPASVEHPLECYGVEPPVRVVGRIDRLDTGRWGEQEVFVVVDYKSGGHGAMKSENVFAGVELQLPLYALAAGELILSDRNPIPLMVGYWRVRDRGFQGTVLYTPVERDTSKEKPKQRRGLRVSKPPAAKGPPRMQPADEWEAIRRNLPRIVEALAGGMRRAEFPVFSQDDYCTRNCPFSTLCRINQVRSLEKTWPLVPEEG